MKTGILITARLGSTRLKRKHLLEINGRPIVQYLLKRIQKEFVGERERGLVEVIIATSDEPENRDFEIFSDEGVLVFYGSINNIPLRHLQTAKAHGLDAIVSIDGDDILCSTKGMRKVYDALKKGAVYVKTSDLPFGLNSFGYSRPFLEQSLSTQGSDVMETGWGRIFDASRLVDLSMDFKVHEDLLRFTLDYDEDFIFFKSIIEKLGERIYDIPDGDLVDVVLSERFYTITEPVVKEYWDNFNATLEKEKKG